MNLKIFALHYLFKSVLFILSCLFSCKKKTYNSTNYDELLPKNSGTVTASLNGREWKSDISLTSYFRSVKNSDTVSISAKIFVYGLERQQLNIDMINLLSPTQKIVSTISYDSISQKYTVIMPKTCNSTFFAVDDDVIENAYMAYDDNTNVIKIEQYNEMSRTIIGSFECHYTRINKDFELTQGLSDTLHFTDGKFELQIK